MSDKPQYHNSYFFDCIQDKEQNFQFDSSMTEGHKSAGAMCMAHSLTMGKAIQKCDISFITIASVDVNFDKMVFWRSLRNETFN